MVMELVEGASLAEKLKTGPYRRKSFLPGYADC